MSLRPPCSAARKASRHSGCDSTRSGFCNRGEAVDAVSDTSHVRGEMHVSREGEGTLLVRLSGSWTLQSARPTVAELQQQLDVAGHVQRLTFTTQELGAWDSS